MRFWLLLCLCAASSHASAGLFADEDARKQVQQLEARVIKLEKALASSEADKEQAIRSTLDLQMQMEALNTELRKLRGQNEEFSHDLQDAEKRQKDFYIDLDTRLRHIEAGRAIPQPPHRIAATVPGMCRPIRWARTVHSMRPIRCTKTRTTRTPLRRSAIS